MRRLTSRFLKTHQASVLGSLLFPVGLVYACGGPAPLTVDMPLHLEEHLDAATIVGSEVPENAPDPIVWDFSEPQPDWKAPEHFNPTIPALILERTDDALRVVFDERHEDPRDLPLHGDIYVELPDLRREEWNHVLIRARAAEGIRDINIGFNLIDRAEAEDLSLGMVPVYGDRVPIVDDGTVQTYRLRADWQNRQTDWQGPWRQMVHAINATRPSTLDILSITLVPKAAVYGDNPVGVGEVRHGRHYRRTLYTHAPGRVEYQVQVPAGGRLDVGLGILSNDVPVTFRVSATGRGGSGETVFEDTCSDASDWHQRSVDLADYAGRTVTLALETDAETAGTVAFWDAPTVSGSIRVVDTPNMVFYVIDGAGAEYTSLYGYNRRTTPNLERLAAEGAVFERAYSNSSWTRPSTASFMTSLQHSVLGGAKEGLNVVPEDVLTMAQHFHRAGYQTGVFTPNPNAGTMSGLERAVDVFQEAWEDFAYDESGHWREGSRYLNDAFWKWREEYPGAPYWVHFQPVDIHADFPEVAPFGGLFVGPEELKTWKDWEERDEEEDVWDPYSEFWETAASDRVEFFTTGQGLYDEAMAHNDYQLGRLVERLKAEGEWENTLLIVAADHSIEAAMEDMGIAIQDSLPSAWNRTIMLRPSISRIPMMFVWPGHIAGGQRFREPVVSMIDVLPTILDLLNLPEPEVMQGQSLAPLLLGEGEVESRPVILDEFDVDGQTGELRGVIEVIDGRWGASLEINPEPPAEGETERRAMWRRPVPLLLYDLWNDPYCLHSIHEERPDLVEKYTAFLEAQFEAHQTLAQLFTPAEGVVLTPEQLETLRALGYIQ